LVDCTVSAPEQHSNHPSHEMEKRAMQAF
jgi:hypothetical protein